MDISKNVPVLISTHPGVFKSRPQKIYPFKIILSCMKATSGNVKPLLFEELKKMEKTNTRHGYLWHIYDIKYYTKGKIYLEGFDSSVEYTVWAECNIINPQTGDIIMRCKLIKRTAEALFFRYGNFLNITVTSNLLPPNYVAPEYVNIQCLHASGKLGRNEIVVLGKIIKMYDIPIQKRLLGHKNLLKKDSPTLGSFNLILSEKGSPYSEKYGFSEELWRSVISETDTTWTRHLRYLINPYELVKASKVYKPNDLDEMYAIYTSYPFKIPEIPVSRAYFKVAEIIHMFKLKVEPDDILLTVADAPGGFAQAMTHMFPNNKVITTSLNRTIGPDKIVYDPIVKNNKNITIDFMKKGDGDITDIENIISLSEKIPNGASIVACDGAFDFTRYPELTKESVHHQLLISEIVTALFTQKLRGSSCFKLYRRFTDVTIKLMYWLMQFYDAFYIYKPRSVRISNTETFIVCTGFRGIPESVKKELVIIMKELKPQFTYEKFLTNFIDIDVPDDFISSIRKFNIFLEEIKIFTREIAIELTNVDKKEFIDIQIDFAKKLFNV